MKHLKTATAISDLKSIQHEASMVKQVHDQEARFDRQRLLYDREVRRLKGLVVRVFVSP